MNLGDMNKILHHDLEVILFPEEGRLKAADNIRYIGEMSFYLGNRFRLKSIREGEKELGWDVLEKGKHTTRYKVKAEGEVRIEWEGKLDSYQGYQVCIIREDLVELSGFGWWFPTMERQSQLEDFTYELTVELPEGWTCVTPGKRVGNKYIYHRGIEDIFLCASPKLNLYKRDFPMDYYIPETLMEHSEVLIKDFLDSLELCTEKFGDLKEENGGTAVISPRGKDGAEWGFERDGLWVVGDTFARYLIENHWKIKNRYKSLAMHETIHGWFGIGVDFEEPWLAEAITQYLEVILTAELWESPDLVRDYFEDYRKRIKDDISEKAINEYDITENMYTQWYLKGSWAFWDLEAVIKREELMDFLRDIYQNYLGKTISYRTFKEEFRKRFEIENFLEHWFESGGFQPFSPGASCKT